MTRSDLVLAASVLVGVCHAAAQPARPAAVAVRARPIPLADVRLTGGPLKHAEDLDAAYLVSLEPDRMMAFLRRSAGLEARQHAGPKLSPQAKELRRVTRCLPSL